MPGIKCSVCHFEFQPKARFEKDWELKDHENIKDCVIHLGKVNQELLECINIIETHLAYLKQKSRKVVQD